MRPVGERTVALAVAAEPHWRGHTECPVSPVVIIPGHCPGEDIITGCHTHVRGGMNKIVELQGVQLNVPMLVE